MALAIRANTSPSRASTSKTSTASLIRTNVRALTVAQQVQAQTLVLSGTPAQREAVLQQASTEILTGPLMGYPGSRLEESRPDYRFEEQAPESTPATVPVSPPAKSTVEDLATAPEEPPAPPRELVELGVDRPQKGTTFSPPENNGMVELPSPPPPMQTNAVLPPPSPAPPQAGPPSESRPSPGRPSHVARPPKTRPGGCGCPCCEEKAPMLKPRQPRQAGPRRPARDPFARPGYSGDLVDVAGTRTVRDAVLGSTGNIDDAIRSSGGVADDIATREIPGYGHPGGTADAFGKGGGEADLSALPPQAPETSPTTTPDLFAGDVVVVEKKSNAVLALVGGVVGFLVGGPVGAGVGAVIASSRKKTVVVK